eukprot:2682577-Rhodomonas_salina.1
MPLYLLCSSGSATSGESALESSTPASNGVFLVLEPTAKGQVQCSRAAQDAIEWSAHLVDHVPILSGP